MRRRRFLGSALATLSLQVLGCSLAERAQPWPLPAPGLPSVPVPGSAAVAPAASPEPTPEPTPTATAAGAPERTARQYLDLWSERRFAEMYALLSDAARESITPERFLQRYRAITEGATILSIQCELGPVARGVNRDGAETADVPFNVTFTTARLGQFRESNTLPLVLAGGEWRVEWTPGLIFRDLTYDTIVRMFPEDPQRGSIYDRNGTPLATQDSNLTIGVIPGEIQDERAVLSALSVYLKVDPAQLKARWQGVPPDHFVPLKTLPSGQLPDVRQRLARVPGIELQERAVRVYPQGATLAHTVGFVGEIDDDLLKRFAHRGYEAGDPAGRTGVERWGEEVLGGERGGRLVILTQSGAAVRTIAEKPARAGGDVYLSIDLDLQRKLEELLRDRPGSIVALDPRTNEVLALVTFPRYDVNKFLTGFSDEEWRKLRDDPRNPFLNRPVAGVYPTGSVFKVVTMAAGLEQGGFTPDQKFRCRGSWDGLGTGLIMGDWLPGGHGELTYRDGLVQSCNIVFYETGKKLESIDRHLLPNFARQFGFGEPTGVLGVVESEGLVPTPEWKQSELDQGWYLGDAINFSIGQGYFQATPLQVANVYSALAVGGSLRNPILVQKTTGPSGQTYTATERRKLPISGANLSLIQSALKQVATTPKGTAYYAFRGVTTPVAAKTGSAENTAPDSHAWFAAYAPADRPELVVVCMIEGSGAGSDVAAPLGRQVIEYYFGRRR